MRLSTFIIVACMALVFSSLVALGTWQVHRLEWKEALIERVNTRLAQAPVSPVQALAVEDNVSPEYSPVEIWGKLIDVKAAYEFTTFDGRSGWNVFLPFRLTPQYVENGKDLVMVNLGFVPYEAKGQGSGNAKAGEAAFFKNIRFDLQKLEGLLRIPLSEKPGRFVNENDPQNQTYFWRDLKTMQSTTDLPIDAFQDWYLDLGLPGKRADKTAFPISGTTIVQFSNNHLQYVVTWYGLALALLGVGGYFLYARRGNKD